MPPGRFLRQGLRHTGFQCGMKRNVSATKRKNTKPFRNVLQRFCKANATFRNVSFARNSFWQKEL